MHSCRGISPYAPCNQRLHKHHQGIAAPKKQPQASAPSDPYNHNLSPTPASTPFFLNSRLYVRQGVVVPWLSRVTVVSQTAARLIKRLIKA